MSERLDLSVLFVSLWQSEHFSVAFYESSGAKDLHQLFTDKDFSRRQHSDREQLSMVNANWCIY